jgi:hypothetical protein
MRGQGRQGGKGRGEDKTGEGRGRKKRGDRREGMGPAPTVHRALQCVNPALGKGDSAENSTSLMNKNYAFAVR